MQSACEAFDGMYRNCVSIGRCVYALAAFKLTKVCPHLISESALKHATLVVKRPLNIAHNRLGCIASVFHPALGLISSLGMTAMMDPI